MNRSKFGDEKRKYIALVYGEDILLIDPRAFSITIKHTYSNGEGQGIVTTPYHSLNIQQPFNLLIVDLDQPENVGYMKATVGWPNMLNDLLPVAGYEDAIWFERSFGYEATFHWTEEIYPKVVEAVRELFK